ncbi:hypothetical protein LGT39_12030 [Demequina sp. TTPB684]|uniref:hypothetical protein n=1 Tax=unclassified Demequina TaxID=2620311 RepID=UPI001CF25124|nr:MULTISPECIES: hypothetical protein [unclassified Demequina]MCB2413571.1 hypothetical protein [Demequina sp. TTPB684]UPU88576.1 hypothetical protein LGT36_001225 [Demequina sp. TMPB413]
MQKRLYIVGSVLAVVALGGVLVANALPLESPPARLAQSGVDLSDSGIQADFDEATSVEVARDAYTVTERDGNGLMRATVSQQPSSVLRDGEWVPISTELTQLDGGLITAVDHPLEPVFAPSADAEAVLEVDNGVYSLALSLVSAKPSASEEVSATPDVADGTAVRYEGAAGGSDVLFQVGQQAVYQTVELASAPSAPLRFEWSIEAPGLVLGESDAGEILFLDPSDEVAFVLPAPSMWDSLGGAEGGMAESASAPVDYTIKEMASGKWTLVLEPSPEWLSDAERVYPVSIDPDIYPGAGMVATYKEDNWTHNYASVPRIGNTKQTSTCCAWRTVLRYPLNSYFGKRVTGAALVANWTYGTTTNRAASLWWAHSFSFAGNAGKLADFSISTQGVAYNGGVFTMVAQILNNSDQYSYMMLMGEENNAIYSRKDLSTYVTFTYVDPAVVTGVKGATPTSPASGPLTQVFVDDIVMEATGVNNTPGTSQLFRYRFTSPNGGAAWTSGWVGSGPYRIPDTALTAGKDYNYTIDTMDTGTLSPVKSKTLSTWKFHTQINPQAPTAITVDGQALTADVTSSVERPILGATVTDVDGGEVWAVFTVKQDGLIIMDSVEGTKSTVSPGGSAISTVELPYAVTSGSRYTVEVRAFDGHLASGVAASDPFGFTGPPRSIREIPGDDDASTGATS